MAVRLEHHGLCTDGATVRDSADRKSNARVRVSDGGERGREVWLSHRERLVKDGCGGERLVGTKRETWKDTLSVSKNEIKKQKSFHVVG